MENMSKLFDAEHSRREQAEKQISLQGAAIRELRQQLQSLQLQLESQRLDRDTASQATGPQQGHPAEDRQAANLEQGRFTAEANRVTEQERERLLEVAKRAGAFLQCCENSVFVSLGAPRDHRIRSSIYSIFHDHRLITIAR